MDDFPICQICKQQFTLKGPVPYLLPCLHAVCETCVTSTAGGVISCSTCQREVNLTETQLQKDVVRQREIFHLTAKHRPTELLCTHEDDGNQAVCWCQECDDLFCEYCQTLHGTFKATRKHAVQDIAEIQPGSMDLEQPCSIHGKHPLEFWDKDCNVLICIKCKIGSHAEHDVEDIEVATQSARSQIEANEKEVVSVGSRHHSRIRKAKDEMRVTDETSNTLIGNISHTFHSLKAVLDQREKEVMVALEQSKLQRKSHLEKKITTSESSHQRCKMTADYIQKTLFYGSKSDLLVTKKIIGETTQACVPPPATEDYLPLPVFSTAGLEQLQSAMSSFGSIQTTMSSRESSFQGK